MTSAERVAAQIFKRDGKGLSARFQKGIATRRAEAAKLIEQALIAERRLAMEEAAKIMCAYCAATDVYGKSVNGQHSIKGWSGYCDAAEILRAAAEKEVQK